MKVLVTGAEGFIGKNLIAWLERRSDVEVLPFDIDTPANLLEEYCAGCDFVYNLAGVNRPEHVEEFMEGNFGFATTLTETLKKHGNNCPVMNSSSIQAVLDNPYGKSKKGRGRHDACLWEGNGSAGLYLSFPKCVRQVVQAKL